MPEISTGCLLSVMFVDIIRASIHDRDTMTMALPESFAIIKQNLWLRELLRSDVAGAVQAGARRKTNDTTIALFVKRNNNKNDNKTSNRILGPNPSAYCDQNKAHGHSTNDCLWRKRLENKKADARVAVNADPTDSTSSINIASNKSDNAIMTIHPMPDFNANTNFFNCRYSS